MATGKTNVRHYRIFVDEFDMSGVARNMSQAGITFQEDDRTAWKDGIVNFSIGKPSVFLSGWQAIFDNTATTGSFSELKDREQCLVSLLLGIRAAPAVGDPCLSAMLEQRGMKIVAEGPILLDVDFFGPGQGAVAGAAVEALPERVFGVVLEPGDTSRSATLTGTSVDNGASSADGALGYLHITVSSAGTWSLKIQDSPDNAAWADLITFDSNGSAVASEQEYVTGTIDRYTRVLFTRTSGSITATCTIVRL